MLVPSPEGVDALLTFVLWNRSFVSDALQGYAESNVVSASHILYEHIYQHVITLFESQWGTAIEHAKQLSEGRIMVSSPLSTVIPFIEVAKNSDGTEANIMPGTRLA